METTRLVRRRADGLPIYAYVVAPGLPPVSIVKMDQGTLRDLEARHAHAHDFLLLVYFEQGGGSLRLGRRQWRVQAGDIYVVAPGEVIGVGDDVSGLVAAQGWGVFFPAEVLGPQAHGVYLAWRTHPLLFPFVRGSAGGAEHLNVAPEERPAWTARFSAIEDELRQRRSGYREAVLAHLTLLLVGVGRQASDIVGELRLKDEPMLADVFGFIEERYREPISLKDVAHAVSLSSGYLTTVVRRKTGRTVQQWIAERRMAEARRLLVETSLAVEEVGQMVGFGDAGYFARCFRRTHGVTPLRWRHASYL